MLDIALRNALLCDGTGSPARRGDLGFRDGRIVEIGEVEGPATREIDAGGLVAAPGFLDPHTHFDAQLTWDGQARPSLEHGVTTVVTGNCSLSLAPLRAQDRGFLGAVFRQIEEMPKSAFDAGLQWNWESFGEYVEAIRPSLGVNVAPLVGHSLLRLWTLGLESRERASTPAEIEAIANLLREGLEAGAVGLSTSMSDIDHEFRAVPCRLGTMDELRALCAVLGETGRVLQVLPEFWEPDLLLTRIDQMAELSLEYGIPTTFSPLFESTLTPDLVGRVLDRLELHAARGAIVHAQMQTRPIDMTFDMTIPNAVFSAMPTWFGTLMQGEKAIRAAFEDATTRAALVEESKTDRRPIALDFDFASLRLSAARTERWRPQVGRSLADLGEELALDAAEVLMQVSLDEDLRARFTATSMAHFDAPRIAEAMKHPQVMVGAGDGGAHVARFATYGDTGLLFSRFVRELGALDLEQAVRRVTADVADAWGIADRGRLEVGTAADVVLFDPDTIARGPEEIAFDLPGGGEDFRFLRRGVGIERVFVNGEEAYTADAGHTDRPSGEIATYRSVTPNTPPSEAPTPIRRHVHPEPGDDWPEIASRYLSDRAPGEAIGLLQSWNLHIVQRPPTNPMTPLDLIFLEPPRPTSA